MNNQVIDNINVEMRFIFKKNETTQRIYETLMPESTYDTNERAKTTIRVENNTLIVNILAKDSVSARAASNSFLKWINLSKQLLSYVKDVNTSST